MVLGFLMLNKALSLGFCLRNETSPARCCCAVAPSLCSRACAYVAGDYRRKGGKHELLINLENKLGCPTQFELMTQETRYLCTAIHECDFICWGNVTYNASVAKSRLCCLIRVIHHGFLKCDHGIPCPLGTKRK